MSEPVWPLPKTPDAADPRHKQSSGLFVPGEGPGHWPGAACKAGPAQPRGAVMRAFRLALSRLHGLGGGLGLLRHNHRAQLGVGGQHNLFVQRGPAHFAQ